MPVIDLFSGKPDAGNPQVRFEEGEGDRPCLSLLYSTVHPRFFIQKFGASAEYLDDTLYIEQLKKRNSPLVKFLQNV